MKLKYPINDGVIKQKSFVFPVFILWYGNSSVSNKTILVAINENSADFTNI